MKFTISRGRRCFQNHLFLLFFLIPISLENLMEGIIEKQISTWCSFYSAGNLFIKGRYEKCWHKFPKANFQNQKQILKGTTLRFGVLENMKGYEDGCEIDRHTDLLIVKDGYSHFIVGLLQEALQFNISYTSSSNWGIYDASHNNWTGLVGLVTNNRTDIIMCHWVMSDILAGFADYLYATLETREAFVFQPHNLPLAKDVFRGTFSHELWISFTLSTFLVIASFKFSTFMHSKVRPDHEPWQWDEVILWAVAAISQQSYSRHPRGSSCRTMFLIGYTITYLLYTSFAAGITSLLALQSHQNKLTFDDVAKMKLKVVFHQDEFYFEFLEKNMPPSFKVKSNIPNLSADSLSGIFSKISRSDFVGYGTTSVLINYIRNKIKFSQQKVFVVFPIPNGIRRKAFLIQKTFPFKDIFNYWLIKLSETGLLEAGRRRYLKTEINNLHITGFWLSADLRNVSSAFEFLIGGWIVSVAVLILEIVWKARHRRILQNIKP